MQVLGLITTSKVYAMKQWWESCRSKIASGLVSQRWVVFMALDQKILTFRMWMNNRMTKMIKLPSSRNLRKEFKFQTCCRWDLNLTLFSLSWTKRRSWLRLNMKSFYHLWIMWTKESLLGALLLTKDSRDWP